MKRSIAFVQLCRSGDIVLLLPVMYDYHRRGYDVYCVVHADFAGILEAAAYVRPLVFSGLHRDVKGAAAMAAEHADQILVTQARTVACDMVQKTVTELDTGRPITARNFVRRLWEKAGAWDRFHELPLHFDVSAAQADRVAGQIPPDDGRPLLALSLQGHSCYFGEYRRFQAWCHEELGKRFRILDLTYDPVCDKGNRQKHVTDLIPLIGRADVLISTNSLPLHVAYAFGTPTISLEPNCSPDDLGGDPTYWRAEPRKHWIGALSCRDALTLPGKQQIISILEGHSGRPTRSVAKG